MIYLLIAAAALAFGIFWWCIFSVASAADDREDI
jgi:hypothetical protein